MASVDDLLTAVKNNVVATNLVANNAFNVLGRKSYLEITSDTLIHTGEAWVARVSVITGGTAGGIYDANTVGGAVTGTQVCVMPATVGIYEILMPVTKGIVVKPGAGQKVSVSFT